MARGEAKLGVVVAPVDHGKAGDWIRLPEIGFTGSATWFDDDAREVLDGNAAMILRYPNRPVEITSVASAEDGEDLAEPLARERAETILRFLLEEYGIRVRRIIVRCRAAADEADRPRVAFAISTGK